MVPADRTEHRTTRSRRELRPKSTPCSPSLYVSEFPILFSVWTLFLHPLLHICMRSVSGVEPSRPHDPPSMFGHARRAYDVLLTCFVRSGSHFARLTHLQSNQFTISHPLVSPFTKPVPIFPSFFYLLPPPSWSLDHPSSVHSRITHSHSLPLLARGCVQSAIKDKISRVKEDPGYDRKLQISWELDEIRNKQSENKLNRGKVLDELKALQERIQKKVHYVCHVNLSGFSYACVTD